MGLKRNPIIAAHESVAEMFGGVEHIRQSTFEKDDPAKQAIADKYGITYEQMSEASAMLSLIAGLKLGLDPTGSTGERAAIATMRNCYEVGLLAGLEVARKEEDGDAPPTAAS